MTTTTMEGTMSDTTEKQTQEAERTEFGLPLDAVDLLAAEIAEPAELALGFLRHGELCVIAGEREANAAGLVLGLGVARSCDGAAWLGIRPAPGPTLLVSTASPFRLKKRIQRLVGGLARAGAPGGGPARGRLHVLADRALRLDWPSGRRALAAALEQTGADLVLLDSAGRLCDEASGLLGTVDAAIARRRVAVVASCSVAAEWARRLRASADSLLRLEHHSGDTSLLSVDRTGPTPVEEIWLKRKDGWFRPVTAARLASEPRRRDPHPATPPAPSRG